jgi:riboflavin synthase
VFTGIVEEVGSVLERHGEGNGVGFTLGCERVREGLGLGDSVAIDGTCLTVTALGEGAFSVQAVATTLERTTLGGFTPGRRVNLERALALGQRLGGHIVQGHVDGVGRITRLERRQELVLIDFSLPDEVASVTMPQGSITVNGISLTVNALPGPGVCQVSIIPFTWEHTNLADLKQGDGVNLEGDTIGKYVRRLLGQPAGGEGAAPEHVRRAWGYQGSNGE